jgi:acetate---CoA ligase (ADP-forming)
VASVATRSPEDAQTAAKDLGFPVVLKTAAPGIAHKSDVGGVVLGIRTPSELTAAYLDLSARLGPEVTVSPMAGPGVELSVGTYCDPLLGPLVVVGAGGTLVEVLSDRAVALPPVDEEDARRMVDRLRVRTLLGAHRGTQAADLGAVLAVVVAVSTIAVELGDLLGAVEVNPLLCDATGAVALDVLVEA